MPVRQALVEDAVGIATVNVRSWQVGYRGLVPQDFLDGLDPAQSCLRWERTLSSEYGRQRTVVAEDATQIVGFAHVCPSRDDATAGRVGELASIYVLPEAWGRGFGRELMSSALSTLIAAGFAEATVWVLEGNHRARRFYEAGGWSADGAARQFDRGFVLPEVRYWHTLT